MLATREDTLEGLGDGGPHPSQEEKKRQWPRKVVPHEVGSLEVTREQKKYIVGVIRVSLEKGPKCP